LWIFFFDEEEEDKMEVKLIVVMAMESKMGSMREDRNTEGLRRVGGMKLVGGKLWSRHSWRWRWI